MLVTSDDEVPEIDVSEIQNCAVLLESEKVEQVFNFDMQ
jgi:hypothetical protein